MKLHAFADRIEDANADLGRRHALDVYRVIAMLTEKEYDLVRRGVEKHDASKPVTRAREIVATQFSSSVQMGILRLKEHPLFTPQMDVNRLVTALADLFR